MPTRPTSKLIAEHYTRLESHETEHRHPDCGCLLRMEEHGGVSLYQCHLHTAAPELLAALVSICDGACWSLGGPQHHIASIDAAKIEAARAAIRAAKGG